MPKKEKQKKSILASTFITVLIVAMLIISGPASAVMVQISGLSGEITQGTSKTFYINMTLENFDHFVPISNISLNISGPTPKNWKFNLINGTIISGDSSIISINNVNISPDSQTIYGNGSGYGVDTNGSGSGYNFTGFGYGFNNGNGSGIVSFSYKVTLSTTNMDVGSYTATAYLNTGNETKSNFASSSTSFTVASPGGGGGGGGGGSSGGGGGGGGGGSDENYSNIELREKYDLHIFKDKTTPYKFKNESNPIIYVGITGNVNAGETTTSVEVLRGTSSLAKIPAPGKVYKNMNIWVGTSGFAVSKNIKSAAIGFKVDNSWLTANGLSGSDVKLFRWDRSQWIQLETTRKEKSDTYTFYEASTINFSPFAISAMVSETPTLTETLINPSGTPEGTVAVTPVTAAVTPGTTAAASPINLYFIIGAFIVILVVLVLYFARKKE